MAKPPQIDETETDPIDASSTQRKMRPSDSKKRNQARFSCGWDDRSSDPNIIQEINKETN